MFPLAMKCDAHLPEANKFIIRKNHESRLRKWKQITVRPLTKCLWSSSFEVRAKIMQNLKFA